MKKFILFFVLGLCFSTTQAQTTSPPLNMTLHAQWDPDTLPTAGGREYNDIWGWVDCSGNEYAIVGSAAYVHFFDVTDPDNISEKGFFAGGQVGTWRDMKTYGDRAYAVSENSAEGLMIFDMSNIQDTIIKSYQSTEFFSRAHNIYVDNEMGRLYAVGTNTQSQGVIILDIATDPDNPILLSSVSLPGGGYIHDMNIKDNIGYCSHGYNGFYVWDFTDPLNPVYQADFTTSGYNHSSWPTADGEHLIYAEEVPLGLPLGILDISDAANGNISQVTTFKFPLLAPAHVNNVPHNPFVRGNYVIVSHYHDGIQIFDISDVQNPTQVAYFDSHANDSYSGYSGCWGIYPFLPSGTIIASDINEGLLVLTADSISLAPIESTSFPDATLTSDIPSPYCQGDAAILQVPNGAISYNWFRDGQLVAENQSFFVPVESGDYYAEVSNNHCSVSSETITVTVSPSPDLSGFVSGTFSLCEGTEILIEAPSGFDNYIWLLDGDVIQQGGNTLNVTLPGTYNLIASLGSCSTTSEDLIIETDNAPSPTILNSDPNFCEGDEFLLETESGNSSYDWYRNNIYLATTVEPTYSVSEGGEYKVLASLGNCEGESPSYSVIMNSSPDATIFFSGPIIQQSDSSALICEGSTITLAVLFDPEAEFQWFKDQEPTGTNSNTLETTESGIYTVQITNAAGCFNESPMITVDISAIASIITFENDILSETMPASSYQWFINGNAITGATSMDYSPTENGDYYCEITNVDGCTAISNVINVILNSVYGIPSVEQFEIFPNPTSAKVNLNIEVSETTDFVIQLIHIDGRVLKTFSESVYGNEVITLDISDLVAGIYFLNLSSQDGQIMNKLVKL